LAPTFVISITAKASSSRETQPMSHAYARNYVHLIFGTRESRKLIKPAIEIELRKALRGIAIQYGIDLIEIGATEDHVHLLVCMPPKIGVAIAVRAFKADSAKQVNEAGHFSPGSWDTELSA
jgi:putative transposase